MAKIRKSLKDHEAIFLGLDPSKNKRKNRPSSRYTLDEDQLEKLFLYRNKGLIDSCENIK